MDLENKVAEIKTTGLDCGHYGMTRCGNCNYDLEEYLDNLPIGSEKQCPECDYSLVYGKKETYPFGGSDF